MIHTAVRTRATLAHRMSRAQQEPRSLMSLFSACLALVAMRQLSTPCWAGRQFGRRLLHVVVTLLGACPSPECHQCPRQGCCYFLPTEGVSAHLCLKPDACLRCACTTRILLNADSPQGKRDPIDGQLAGFHSVECFSVLMLGSLRYGGGPSYGDLHKVLQFGSCVVSLSAAALRVIHGIES